MCIVVYVVCIILGPLGRNSRMEGTSPWRICGTIGIVSKLPSVTLCHNTVSVSLFYILYVLWEFSKMNTCTLPARNQHRMAD